ncbi:hypothetical protein D0T25_29155 [Duganella sp. BJB488]|uniref:hypothetical protein n=1 Tax=unclassified Duganella TaxID=2636909 RepID=UPI000E34F35D|nr:MULTISPECIES: hypothetical protein [unclassified Duganella]RFP09737.1 hypothetical protein D0T26_28975 [Duganella sp. BJB489]RFP13401.1 hypothetical protein D0T25_29155 [Duganella sp. BJB488]RFP29305.1 hypothetical protein D0T24_29505 [Duganella sp. BJB480]
MNVINALDLEPIKVKLMHKESGEGWSLERANAIETEYRRFLFLMKQFPNEQTAPLVDVDTFWHYHILDTMKYAVDCEAVFGYFLHHFPYIGLRGEDDLEAHERLGNRMQELYEETFGESYLRGAMHQDVAYSAAPGATAYSAAPGVAANTAYSAAPGVAAKTAYSAAPGVAANTAYSAAPGVAAKTAYSAAPGVAAKTAYSAAPGVAAKTAYSAAPGVAAKTAYSAAPGVAANTAYSAAPGAGAKTAYSAAPGVTAYSAAPGKVAEGLQTAADANAIIEQARIASFYSDRPRLTPSA